MPERCRLCGGILAFGHLFDCPKYISDFHPPSPNQQIDKLTRHIKELREALESIAANTCCDKCQEAALVARAVLEKVKK